MREKFDSGSSAGTERTWNCDHQQQIFFYTLCHADLRGHLCFPIPATSVFFREVHAVAPLFQFLSPFLGFLFPRPLLLFLSSRPSCGVGRCVQLFRPSYQTFAPFGVKGEEEETEEEEGLPSLLSHSEREPPFPHRRHLHHFMASDFWVFLSVSGSFPCRRREKKRCSDLLLFLFAALARGGKRGFMGL